MQGYGTVHKPSVRTPAHQSLKHGPVLYRGVVVVLGPRLRVDHLAALALVADRCPRAVLICGLTWQGRRAAQRFPVSFFP